MLGALGTTGPAYAGPAPSGGICNGVLNQAARGTVQANLLQAAAKQNAAVIKQLQDRKAGLVAQSGTITRQITAAQQEIAALDAAKAGLEQQIAESEMRLEAMNASKAQVTAVDRT